MGTLGPNSGTTFADDSALGAVAVSNPANVGASDNSYATSILLLGQISHYLKVTGFAFAVPLDATILGVLVEIERSTTLSNSMSDQAVNLLKAGAIAGDNKGSASQWPTSDAYASYGSASDLWGTTWTPAQLNATDFGMVISAVAALGATVQIDHVRITITYQGSNRTMSDQKRLATSGGMSCAERVS